MKKLLCAALVAASMSGCVSFQYGSPFSQPEPQADYATLVIYRYDTAPLAPAGKAPLPYQIGGILGDEPINPHSFKVIKTTPGKTILNARTGLIDLRREAILERGKVHFAKASCYYAVTQGFCKIELVSDSVALNEVAALYESNGIADKK